MKKAPSHFTLSAVSNSYSIIQIRSNYAKLPQPKTRGRQAEKYLQKHPKIGSRLSYNLTTNPFFYPHFCRLSYI